MMSDAYQMGLSTGAGLGTLAQNLQQSNQVLLPALLQHQMQARLAQAQLAQAQAQMKETSAYHTGMLNQRAQELDQKKIDSENMKAYRDAMVEQSKQAKLNNLMTLQANTMQKQQALEQQRALGLNKVRGTKESVNLAKEAAKYAAHPTSGWDRWWHNASPEELNKQYENLYMQQGGIPANQLAPTLAMIDQQINQLGGIAPVPQGPMIKVRLANGMTGSVQQSMFDPNTMVVIQ